MSYKGYSQKLHLVCLTVCALVLYSSSAPAGLIASYEFNNNALDSSGNTNHATLAGGVGFTAESGGFTGNAGDYAINFDAANEVVTAPAAAFQSMSTNNAATVSLWAYGDSSQPRNDTIFSFNQSGNRQFMSHAPWGNGTLYFDTGGCCGGNTRQTTNTAPAEEEGQWNHLLYIKDGNNKQLWINGINKINQVGGATAVINAFNEVAIGAERTNAMNNYRGLVDDFGVWDVGLDVGQVQAVYNLATEPGLQYGVADSNKLFDLFDAGTGELEIGDLTWENTTGLIGAAGDVLDLGDGEFALILDPNGGGVLGAIPVVPEPSSLAIFSLLLCLAGYGYRRGR